MKKTTRPGVNILVFTIWGPVVHQLRYIGNKNAKAYGERNSGEGEVLVRIKPYKIIGEKNIADWEE